MNSPGYKTTPDESGLGGCPSPIHRAQLTGPENSFPGDPRLVVRVDDRFERLGVIAATISQRPQRSLQCPQRFNPWPSEPLRALISAEYAEGFTSPAFHDSAGNVKWKIPIR